ncbi:MAG: DNA repair exonuclease [Cryomorphaceae bacterium]|nr:MAG: DNA repair exonuclease [Cryomorphaceae bacterium]
MIKLLATGDLHLGRSSTQLPAGADEYPVSKVWKRIVEKAINLKVDALLLSGDIIDRENRFFEAVGQLQSGFAKLRDADIPVYMVSGNHDFDVLPDVLNHDNSAHVHLLGASGSWQTEVFAKNGIQLQLVGWSFPTQYFRQDPINSLLREQLNPSWPTIGLLHGEVGAPDSSYAPLEVSRLQSAGVGLWVLGHIHKPEHWASPGCDIWYPGSPQALSPKEQGVHGPLLIEVHGISDIRTTQVPLSPVRYETLSVPITRSAGIRAEVMSAFNAFAHSEDFAAMGVEHLVIDLILTGEQDDITSVDGALKNMVEDLNLDLNGIGLSVRKVINQLVPAISNMEELAQQSSPAGLLAESILALQREESTPLLEKMKEEWNNAFSRVKSGTAYTDLQGRGKDVLFLDEQQARKNDYLLNACKKLLGELMQQQNSGQP